MKHKEKLYAGVLFCWYMKSFIFSLYSTSIVSSFLQGGLGITAKSFSLEVGIQTDILELKTFHQVSFK